MKILKGMEVRIMPRWNRRRDVRRSDDDRLEGVDRRIERRFESMGEAFDEGDYESLVRHAEAVANAAEQGAELTDR